MDHSRIILTKQCNLDCYYCTAHTAGEQADRSRVITACRQAVSSGFRRFQLSGGEPLLYDDVPGLIAELKAVPGVEWVSLTTNGTLLYPQIQALKQAGLDGVNLHLDACDAFTFTAITGKSQLLNEILKGIWAAVARDLPLTISAVLLEENAPNLAVLAGLAKQYDLTVRFVVTEESRKAGIDEKAALEVLSRSVKGLTADGAVYRAPGLKGKLEFGTDLWGAFGMERSSILALE